MSLPAGAKRLEYIRSDGKAYINTQFTPNQDTRVVVKIARPASTSNQFVFGARGGTHTNTISLLYQGGIRSDWNTTQKSIASSTVSALSSPLTIDQNKNVLTVNGTASVSHTYAAFTAPCPLTLFGVNTNGTVGTLTTTDLYDGQIYDNGLLERDYIPCQLADGSIGLWDDVYGEFYGNAGSGSFTAGPEVTDEWKGTQLEYVESDGTQYTDTAFKANQDTRVICKGQFVNFSQNTALFGHRYGTSSQRYEFFANTSSNWYSPYNASAGSSGAAHTDVIVVDKNKNQTFIDGTLFDTQTYSEFQCSGSMFLFAENSKGSIGVSGSVRTYYCQIYDNGTKIRDYVPWLHASGVAGLLDKANGRFYASASTTDLIAGPVAVLAPPVPAGLTVSFPTPTQVKLTWAASEGATGYRVYRDGVLVSDQTSLSFTETVGSGQTYTYGVTAYSADGESDAATVSILTPPAAPSTLERVLCVKLRWASVDCDGYKLYRDGKLLTTTTATNYLDEDVEENQTYTYTLTAYNSSGESEAAKLSVNTKAGYFIYQPAVDSAFFQ